MNSQFDLAAIFGDAIASVPAQLASVYAAAPESWNTVGVGMLALLGIALIARRRRGRSPR
jgi:MYXO-CTERM domain-containing protein